MADDRQNDDVQTEEAQNENVQNIVFEASMDISSTERSGPKGGEDLDQLIVLKDVDKHELRLGLRQSPNVDDDDDRKYPDQGDSHPSDISNIFGKQSARHPLLPIYKLC